MPAGSERGRASVALALLLTLGACGSAGPAETPSRSTSTTSPTTSPTTSTTTAGPTPGEDAVIPVQAASAEVDPGHVPVRLRIAAIDLDVPLAGLGTTAEGTLEVPTDYAEVGWFERGPAPGDRGPAIIAGHVDSRSGPAPFFRLDELDPGAAVVVTRADGSAVTFTVDGTEQFAKDAFPTGSVYGPVPGPVLRLITCGGTFDRSRGHYRDNVVVYAS